MDYEKEAIDYLREFPELMAELFDRPNENCLITLLAEILQARDLDIGYA